MLVDRINSMQPMAYTKSLIDLVTVHDPGAGKVLFFLDDWKQ